MPNQKYLLNRRRFLATTAAATGAIAHAFHPARAGRAA